MTLDATPIQSAPDAGHLPAPPTGADAARAACERSRSQSLLSRCVAWLFGIDALLRELEQIDRQIPD